MIDLSAASLFPMLPISQAPDVTVKPTITVIGENEFLILSWTGASTLGVFITGDGDPVRGTLEWASHPLSVGTSSPPRARVSPLWLSSLHPVVHGACCPRLAQPHRLRSTTLTPPSRTARRAPRDPDTFRPRRRPSASFAPHRAVRAGQAQAQGVPPSLERPPRAAAHMTPPPSPASACYL